MTKLIKTHHRTHNLLQNVAAISGDFHTHKLYHCFYDAFGKHMDGFIGNYNICIEMARVLTDWETANGGSRAYDDLRNSLDRDRRALRRKHDHPLRQDR